MTIILFDRLGAATWEKLDHEKIQNNEITIRAVDERGEAIICEMLVNGYTVKIPGLAKIDISLLSGVTQDVKVRYHDAVHRVGQLSVIGGYAIPTADQDHSLAVKGAISAERAAKFVIAADERIKALEHAYLGSNITHLT